MIGGITTYGNFHYWICSTTNAENVMEWFKDLSRRENLMGAIVVMDNHKAHKSILLKQFSEEEGFLMLFMPPSSSEFNPVEKVSIMLIFISLVYKHD